MQLKSSLIPGFLLPALEGRCSKMSEGELFVYIVCLIIYTIASIFIVRSFKTTTGCIIGSGCLVAGGIGLYYIIPLIVALLMGLLELIIAGAVIAAIIGCLSGS